MSLKNVSTGGGLVVVGLGLCAIAGAMVVSGSGGSAHAGVNASAASAVASAAMAQGGGEPTIVWYQAVGMGSSAQAIFRAWSDGRIEGVYGWIEYPTNGVDCPRWRTQYVSPSCPDQPWVPISSPNDGLAAFADLNADAKVDAQDLAQVLSRWGDAPRNDIPPSECPLNLINP
jgi:hypothetical protein